MANYLGLTPPISFPAGISSNPDALIALHAVSTKLDSVITEATDAAKKKGIDTSNTEWLSKMRSLKNSAMSDLYLLVHSGYSGEDVSRAADKYHVQLQSIRSNLLEGSICSAQKHDQVKQKHDAFQCALKVDAVQLIPIQTTKTQNLPQTRQLEITKLLDPTNILQPTSTIYPKKVLGSTFTEQFKNKFPQKDSNSTDIKDPINVEHITDEVKTIIEEIGAHKIAKKVHDVFGKSYGEGVELLLKSCFAHIEEDSANPFRDRVLSAAAHMSVMNGLALVFGTLPACTAIGLEIAQETAKSVDESFEPIKQSMIRQIEHYKAIDCIDCDDRPSVKGSLEFASLLLKGMQKPGEYFKASTDFVYEVSQKTCDAIGLTEANGIKLCEIMANNDSEMLQGKMLQEWHASGGPTKLMKEAGNYASKALQAAGNALEYVAKNSPEALEEKMWAEAFIALEREHIHAEFLKERMSLKPNVPPISALEVLEEGAIFFVPADKM